MDFMLLKAVYELRRQEIILAKRNPATADAIPDTLAFAYANRLCPVLDGGDTTKEDPFESAYYVPRDFANTVLNYCDELFSKNEQVTFYGLERKIGRERRLDIIVILRYAFLAEHFNPGFFKGVLSDCPDEAHGLDSTFNLFQEVRL